MQMFCATRESNGLTTSAWGASSDEHQDLSCLLVLCRAFHKMTLDGGSARHTLSVFKEGCTAGSLRVRSDDSLATPRVNLEKNRVRLT